MQEHQLDTSAKMAIDLLMFVESCCYLATCSSDASMISCPNRTRSLLHRAALAKSRGDKGSMLYPTVPESKSHVTRYECCATCFAPCYPLFLRLAAFCATPLHSFLCDTTALLFVQHHCIPRTSAEDLFSKASKQHLNYVRCSPGDKWPTAHYTTHNINTCMIYA